VFNDRLKRLFGSVTGVQDRVDYNLIFHGNVSIESGKEAVRHFMSLSSIPDAFLLWRLYSSPCFERVKDRNYNIQLILV